MQHKHKPTDLEQRPRAACVTSSLFPPVPPTTLASWGWSLSAVAMSPALPEATEQTYQESNLGKTMESLNLTKKILGGKENKENNRWATSMHLILKIVYYLSINQKSLSWGQCEVEVNLSLTSFSIILSLLKAFVHTIVHHFWFILTFLAQAIFVKAQQQPQPKQ